MDKERYYAALCAAAGAHGMLKVLCEEGGIDAVHLEQATRVCNELAQACWPDDANMRVEERMNG